MYELIWFRADVTHHVKCISGQHLISSLSPVRFEWNFREAIFKLILKIGGSGIFCEIALRCVSLNLSDDKSVLI